MHLSKSLLLPIGLAALVPALNAQVVVDFDAETDYTGNFQLNDGNNGSYTLNSGAGVGGTNGFLNIGTGGEFNVASTGVTKTAGTIYEVSYLINIGTPATDINDFRAGFVRSTGSNFAGGGDSAHAYLRSDSGVNTYTIELFGDAVATGNKTSQFSLDANNWYQFSVQMTLTSATSVSLSAALYNRGADGTAAASLVTGSNIATTTNIDLTSGGGFNGADVFAGFTTRNNTGSVALGMDNFAFAAVPEPSTYALLAGFLTLGVVLFRRRRS